MSKQVSIIPFSSLLPVDSIESINCLKKILLTSDILVNLFNLAKESNESKVLITVYFPCFFLEKRNIRI